MRLRPLEAKESARVSLALFSFTVSMSPAEVAIRNSVYPNRQAILSAAFFRKEDESLHTAEDACSLSQALFSLLFPFLMRWPSCCTFSPFGSPL